MSTPSLVTWLATLSDTARLRILRLLDREELSVGELARALQLPQSTVSRHLKVLHDGGWIGKRVEGTASYYHLAAETLPEAAGRLWQLSRDQLADTPTFEEDDRRLVEVIAERMTDSRAYFGRVGGEWDAVRRELFGDTFTAEAMLGLLDPDWVVADLGCGTGNAAELLAPLVRKVIAVDREAAMLDAARKRLGGCENVEFRRGEVCRLPIEDGEVDIALIVLVLHHVDRPEDAVQEMGRVLRPGGRAVIVDMVSHDRETYRYTMGHHHLGFAEADIAGWSSAAGLELIRFHRLRPDTTAKGPGLFVATIGRVR
ncbi:MAG: ArsR/SmtB family transcription factor [Planctomycetota bacterium]|jgi:ArsR family transcriptional regulator